MSFCPDRHIAEDLEGAVAKEAKSCYDDNPNSRSLIKIKHRSYSQTKVQAISLNEPDEGPRKE